MPDFRTRLLVFDTESTGVDTSQDRVVELAAVYFVDRRLEDRRQMLVNPGIPIPKEATAVHGIGDDDVRDKPAFGAIAERFAQHVDGRAHGGDVPVLVGYNAIAYDVPLLNTELERHGHPLRIDASEVVDAMVFVRQHLRHLRSRKLGEVCAHFGVTLANAHRAWADAKATGELLFAMIERGLVPDDVDETLALQRALVPEHEREWNEFGYWLFRDRATGDLRIGAGKHCGTPLDEVEPDYLGYLLRTIEDLPAAVRSELERRVRRPTKAPGTARPVSTNPREGSA